MKSAGSFLVCTSLLVTLAGCRSTPEPLPTAAPRASMQDEQAVAYRVTFTGTWTASSHPLDYPEAGLLTGPHFSGLIGAAHDERYALFEAGGRPTPGLERLSEEGKHSPLDEEIRAAIVRGSALELFETGPVKDLSSEMAATVQGEVRLDRAHPMVSLAAMIAPSPDWFAGLSSVRLMESDGSWAARKELLVFAWDSGGDRGTTYKAADLDASPKDPTALNDAPHFLQGGQRLPVARVVFERIDMGQTSK